MNKLFLTGLLPAMLLSQQALAQMLPDDATTTVRKVQIQKAYDEKRWYWKGCDGMKETTWPGVYNRSRLAGRFDYIQLPDWDCYSTSGKQVRFIMPDEPWNHVEMTGSAWGSLAVSADTAGTNAKNKKSLTVTLHNISSKEAPATRIALVNAQGNIIAETSSQPLAAPQDMTPSRQQVHIAVPKGTSLTGCSVVIDPDNSLSEIYKQNNRISIE